jgi:WD40 repeat protein/tRNA A-37 threonylcarbamoyl transferase component Bud32
MFSTDATNDLAFDLVARWEDEVARGNRVPLEEVCADHPELLPAVREIVRRLAAAAALFPSGSGRDPAAHEDRCPPGWAKVGHGASSVVYRGEDATFGTTVAYKVLNAADRLPSVADVVRQMKRFEQEARILAQLKHDGIVRIFKTFTYGGRPVLEMEYLPGGSLLAHLAAVRARGPAGVARFLERVARAVGFAHEHNIVHRDLKPSNILLDAAGRPCVSDFGVAKLIQGVDAPAPDPAADTDPDGSGLTALGRQPGTRAYMAPEQFDPTVGPITPATDVWALGVILYELVNGTRPFAAGSPNEWAEVVCRGPLPRPLWAAWRSNRRLEAIALRCLSRDPAKRYRSAAELADALARAARPRWPAAAVAAGVLLAVTAAGIAALTPRPPEAQPVGASEPAHAALDREAREAYRECEAGKVAKGVQAFEALLARVPADAPDLRAAVRANISLWSATLAAADGSYRHAEPITAGAVSRDGRRLVVGDERGGVVVWDAAAGKVVKRLAGHAGQVTAAAISPDGKFAATGGEDGGVRVWSLDGDATAPTAEAAVKHWVFALAFAADGRAVAVGVRPVEQSGVGFWDLRTGGYAGPTAWAAKSFASRFFVDPDSRTLVLPVGNGSAEVWDLDRRARRGRLDSRPGASIRSVAFGRDGRTIATGGDALQLWDAATGTLISEECAEPGLEVIGFAPAGAVAVQVNREYRLWQPNAGCFDPLALPRPRYPEYWLPTAEHLFAVEDRYTVVRLRWPTGGPQALPLPRAAMVIGAVGDHGGTRVAVVTAKDQSNAKEAAGTAAGIDVWEPRTGRRVGPPIRPKNQPLFAAQFGPGADRLAFYAGQPPGPHRVQLLDPTTGDPVGELHGTRGTVYCLPYLHACQRWLTAGHEPVVRVWDDAGVERGRAALPAGGFLRSAVGPDGRLVVLGNLAGDVACVTVSPAAPELAVRPLRPRIGGCEQVGVSADGATVLALGRDGQLWAADGDDLRPVAVAGDVARFFPHPGGRGWVTCHRNGAVRWWAGPAAAPEQEWVPAEGDQCVTLDPAGAVLVTARSDGKAQAWSVAARLPLGPPVNHQKPMLGGAWAADGLLVSRSTKAVRVWTPLAPPP